jgi:predicted nucleic acid-binding protein
VRLFISDTNIFIDLVTCGLVEQMFQLPYEFAVPDMLYFEELADNHGDLPAYGLQIMTVDEQYTVYAGGLQRIYPKAGPNDLLALALAKQENSPLISGDGALRLAASNEGIEVKGTLWIMEEFVRHHIITVGNAEMAFEVMKRHNRFLPWNDIRALLRRLDEEFNQSEKQ